MSQQSIQWDLTKVFADEYVDPTLFKLLIKDNQNELIVNQYDPFKPYDNEIKLTSFEFANGVNQSGGFTATINDSIDKVMDRDIIDNGVYIIFQGAKKNYQSKISNFFYGYCDQITEVRRRGQIREYILEGLGTLGVLNNVILDFRASARRSDLDTNEFAFDKKFVAWRLMRQLFEDKNLLPVQGGGNQTLQQRGKFTLDGISEAIKQFIPILEFPLVYAAQIAGAIADMVGADLYIDENNNVVFQFPDYGRNITFLKDHYDATLSVDEQDLAFDTSYVLGGGYSRRGSTRQADGFANYLVGVAASSTDVSANSTIAQSYTDLYVNDICQQFIADSSTTFNLGLMLQKVGTGTEAGDPSTDTLKGEIVRDLSNKPTGKVIGRFEIPITDILTSPTIINQIKVSQINSAAIGEPHFIILRRKGLNHENTIRWYNDNKINESPDLWSGFRRYRDKGDGVFEPISNISSGWITAQSGPTYTYSISDPADQIVCEMGDIDSMERWHKVDGKVAPTWITNHKELLEYMAAILRWSSKKRWIYSFPVVTIPTRAIKAGHTLNVRDKVLKITGVDEVDASAVCQEIAYRVNAAEDATGTNVCEITAMGFQNPFDYTKDY